VPAGTPAVAERVTGVEYPRMDKTLRVTEAEAGPAQVIVAAAGSSKLKVDTGTAIVKSLFDMS
jgi:hypothetical protein